MKTTTKKATVKKTKKVTIITAEQKAARAEAYKNSAYNMTVNVPNKEAKELYKSIGGARAYILTASEAGASYKPSHITLLKYSKKSQALYEFIKKGLKPYASGKFSPYKLIQFIYSNETEMYNFKKENR